METTTAYTFGVLTVVAITFVVVFIAGIVKVFKQQKEMASINQDISELHNRIASSEESLHESLHRYIVEEVNNLNSRIDGAFQHTDSRVDKLQDKLIVGLDKLIQKESKQLIKG